MKQVLFVFTVLCVVSVLVVAQGGLHWANIKVTGSNGDQSLSGGAASKNYIYATGAFSENGFVCNSTTYTPTSADSFLLKYDTDLNCLWAVQIGGDGAQYGYSITVTDSEDIYIGGTFTNQVAVGGITKKATGSGTHMFIIKLSSSGSLLQFTIVAMTSGMVQPLAFAHSSATGLVVVGTFTETVVFNNVTYTSANSNYDGYILTMNDLGNITAVRVFQGAEMDILYGVAIAPNGNIVFSGKFTNYTKITDTVSVYSGKSSQQAFIGSFNSDLSTLNWVKVIGGASTFSDSSALFIASDSSVYSTGHVMGDCDFGNGKTLPSADGSYVAKYSGTSGDVQWVSALPGNTFSVTMNSQGALFVSGTFADEATFGSKTFKTAYSQDLYITIFSASSGQLLNVGVGGGSDFDILNSLVAIDDRIFGIGRTNSASLKFGNDTYTGHGSNDFLLIEVSPISQCFGIAGK
jgi:hypothetical protein